MSRIANPYFALPRTVIEHETKFHALSYKMGN
jgi:hypothetical protein